MNCTTTSAPIAHAFDPAEWLSRFERLGGGYVVNADGKLDLGFLHATGTPAGQREAREMLAALSEQQSSLVLEHLVSAPASVAAIRHRWDRLRSLMEQAEAAYEAYTLAVYKPCEGRYEGWFVEQGVTAQPNRPISVTALAELRERNPFKTEWDHVNDRIDLLSEQCSDTESELMETPAPGLSELAWKLDQLLDFNGKHSTGAWSRDYVAQTVADCRRLLVGES